MKLSVAEAQDQLPELVRRAESGDEVVLTENGRDMVRLEPVKSPDDRRERRKALFALLDKWAEERGPNEGPDAAHSQDFLYDEYGLPK